MREGENGKAILVRDGLEVRRGRGGHNYFYATAGDIQAKPTPVSGGFAFLVTFNFQSITASINDGGKHSVQRLSTFRGIRQLFVRQPSITVNKPYYIFITTASAALAQRVKTQISREILSEVY